MNDLMHDQAPGDSELEQALREALDQRALMARPSPDARAAVRARVAERRSGRRVRRGVGAAAAAAAALGGGLWLQAGSPVTVGVATGGDPTTTTAPAALTQPADPDPRPAALPRLVLDGDGFFVEHAEEYVSGDLDGDAYLQTFRGASGRPAAPTFTIVSMTANEVAGIGEDAPPEVTRIVDVGGQRGYLVDGDSFSPSLGWRLEDGGAVLIRAIGVGGEGLVELANGLQPRPQGPGWTPAPPSMTLIAEGQVSYAGASSEVQYRTDRGVRADVRVSEGDRLRFEEVLLDRADAATTMQPIEVRGHEGVMFGTDASFIVVWHEGDVIGEVVLVDMPEAEARATLATLHEVSEDEWQALA